MVQAVGTVAACQIDDVRVIFKIIEHLLGLFFHIEFIPLEHDHGKEFYIYHCEHDNWKWINPQLPAGFLDQIYSSRYYWKTPESVQIDIDGEPFPLLGYSNYTSEGRKATNNWLAFTRVKEIEEIQKLILGESTRGKFLEVGFGSGEVLDRAYKEGWDVTGVDISDGAVARIGEEYPELAQFVRKADFEQENFDGEKFDVIAAYNLIEHLHDIPSFLRKANNLLSDNGILAIDFPIIPNSLPIYRSYIEHLHHPSLKGMEIMLKKYGYELVQVVCPPIDALGEKLGVANIIIYARKIDSDYNVNGFNIVKFIPGKGKDEAGTRKQYEKIKQGAEPSSLVTSPTQPPPFIS